MSRWTDTFSNHPFQENWKRIVDLSSVLELPNEITPTHVEELSRLKKVILFISKLLKSLDPELIPVSIWASFQEQAVACEAQLNEFSNTKVVKNLANANGHLDNLLSYVRPYMASAEQAAQAASAAYLVYAATVREQIEILRQRSNETVDLIQGNKERANTVANQIENKFSEVKAFEAQLFAGTTEEKSIKDKIEELLREANTSNKAIAEFHKKLTTGNEQEAAIVLQVQQAVSKAESNSKLTKEAYITTKAVLDELSIFHERVFGANSDDDGTTETGLKSEIESRIADLEAFKVEQHKRYNALLKEIETLLPGATSAGLSTAYLSLKESFNNSIRHNSFVFYAALIGIALTGYVTTTIAEIADLKGFFMGMLHKAPVFGALVWLALHASRRRSEDRRLQQEYAHKEALAKSYHSFKQQIEALSLKDPVLAEKLLEKTIEAISLNASSTLDGKHGDKIPTAELTEKAIDKVADIVRAAKGN